MGRKRKKWKRGQRLPRWWCVFSASWMEVEGEAGMRGSRAQRVHENREEMKGSFR